ncbi:MAG TPA: cyclic nucleotide-binding domain-containing protein, partial [Nannocystaceae bacterium]|nr:cyclic nucleotide-binding domain-containing protein [Nannocystaceae bacterium]
MDKGSPPTPPAGAAATVEALIRELFADGATRLVYEGEIGRGGIGAVSIVFDRALRRRAAMKTLHPRTYNEELLVRGFIREAQITGQLGHPHIVPVFDFGVEGGQLFFTMKLVEGRGLNKLISKRHDGGDLSYDYERVLNQVEILIKVCDAVAFAHSRGVLHCDLKAENVMVGDFGEVYLMDWGGAQLLRPREGVDQGRWVQGILDELPGESTEGLVFGTPAYMSPEQAFGRRSQMDERADIFSLGAILYEILCGRAPYRAGNNLEALRLAQRYEIPPLDDLVNRAVIPRELVRIAMKAMARAPADRYATVEAMKLDLLRLMRGGSSFPTVRFPAGAQIIREGEVGDAAYSILSGRVEAYREADGERVSLRVMGPGEVFGETAIFASSPRTASVVALEDSALIIITGEV